MILWIVLLAFPVQDSDKPALLKYEDLKVIAERNVFSPAKPKPKKPAPRKSAPKPPAKVKAARRLVSPVTFGVPFWSEKCRKKSLILLLKT